jgi:MarR family transcriptional regulator, organic hydroperoxide resistance regulator
MTRPRPPERDDDPLAFLEILWALDHALNTVSKRMLATQGITGPQRAVIRMIGRFPGLTAREIAARAHHHPSTLSVILRRLAKEGHVVRASDPADQRRVRLVLSSSGRRIDERREGNVEGAVRLTLARLTPAQIEAAKTLLQTLVEELERVANTGKRRG